MKWTKTMDDLYVCMCRLRYYCIHVDHIKTLRGVNRWQFNGKEDVFFVYNLMKLFPFVVMLLFVVVVVIIFGNIAQCVLVLPLQFRFSVWHTGKICITVRIKLHNNSLSFYVVLKTPTNLYNSRWWSFIIFNIST